MTPRERAAIRDAALAEALSAIENERMAQEDDSTKYYNMALDHVTTAILALRSTPSASPSGAMEWQPISTVPTDTTQGDFIIALFNSNGDCCWVQLVRNPTKHHGVTIASHWCPVNEPDGGVRSHERL